MNQPLARRIPFQLPLRTPCPLAACPLSSPRCPRPITLFLRPRCTRLSPPPLPPPLPRQWLHCRKAVRVSRHRAGKPTQRWGKPIADGGIGKLSRRSNTPSALPIESGRLSRKNTPSPLLSPSTWTHRLSLSQMAGGSGSAWRRPPNCAR